MIDGSDLRAVMTHFATGVAVASTGHGETADAMTLNSLTSVSLVPPLVLISLGVESRFGAAVREWGTWGVSILPAEHGDLARRLAAADRPKPVLDGVPHHTGLTGVPLLDDAVATLECRFYAIHRAGDHDLHVGEVVATHVRDGAQDVRALVNHRGRFGTFTS